MKYINVSSFLEVGSDLGFRISSLSSKANIALGMIQNVYYEILKANVPVRTGFMERKLKKFKSPSSPAKGLYRAGVGWKASDFSSRGNGAFYPPFVDRGTGIHATGGAGRAKIYPVNGDFLRIPVDGGWISVKSSKGQKAQKFMEKTQKEIAPIVSSIIKNVCDGVFT